MIMNAIEGALRISYTVSSVLKNSENESASRYYLSKLIESLNSLKEAIAKEELLSNEVKEALQESQIFIVPETSEFSSDYVIFLIEWLKSLKTFVWLLQRKKENLDEISKIFSEVQYLSKKQEGLLDKKKNLEQLEKSFDNRISFSLRELGIL